MAVIMQFPVSIVTPCSLVARYQSFGGTWCLHFQGGGIRLFFSGNSVGYREREFNPTFSLHHPVFCTDLYHTSYYFAVKMEAAGSSETLVRIYSITRCDKPEVGNLETSI
jgi:hypothetical protein